MALQNCSIWTMQTFLGNTYHIPDYQREYAWEADELSDFWDDLELTKNGNDEMPHFLVKSLYTTMKKQSISSTVSRERSLL